MKTKGKGKLADWKPRKQNDILRYVGSKRKVVGEVWRHFGKVSTYIEPFCGSAVVYLTRPEQVDEYLRKVYLNDLDLQLVNYLRAVHYHREEMLEKLPTFIDGLALKYAVQNDRQPKLETCDVDQAAEFFYRRNTGIAGFGSVNADTRLSNELLKKAELDEIEACDVDQAAEFFYRKNTSVNGCAGVYNGCKKSSDRLKEAELDEVIMSGMKACDVDQATEFFYRLNTGLGGGSGVVNTAKVSSELLKEKLVVNDVKYLKILNVDWKYSVANSRTQLYENSKHNVGVFLDPPYAGTENYYSEVSMNVSKDSYEWAVENASEQLRIAYCCYSDHFPCPDGWKELSWNGNTFSVNGSDPNRKEVIYFSPHSELPED